MGDWKVYVPNWRVLLNHEGNPSFETGTTGFSTGGTNTLAQSTTLAYSGIYSGKVTYVDSTTLLTTTFTHLGAEAEIYHCWAYVPSSYSGGDITIDITGSFVTSSDVSGISSSIDVTDSANLDKWVHIGKKAIQLGGGTCTVTIAATDSVDTGAVYFDAISHTRDYVPDVNGTNAPTWSSFFDGDSGEGYSWLGDRHASASRKEAWVRTSGRVYDLRDDFDFQVRDYPGAGKYPVNVQGSLRNYLGTLPNVRPFFLSGAFVPSATLTLHEQRQKLQKVFDTENGNINVRPQGVTLIYTGATPNKVINVAYDGGLGWEDVRAADIEYANLRFIAHDPMFYELGSSGAVMDVNDTATVRTIAAMIDGEWSALGPPHASGTYGSVLVVRKAPDGILYLGGSFTNFNNITGADYIVSYDPVAETYAIVGGVSDLNGIVYDIQFSADGTLYAGGLFTNAGAVAAADYIASWTSGGGWAALGTPNTGTASITAVFSMAFDPGSGDLWAGGDFINFADIAAADRIAIWDGSSWAAPTDFPNSDVFEIRFAPNGDFYMVGDFTSLNTLGSCKRIASFIDSTWAQVGQGLNATNVAALTVTQSGEVYMGGDFTQDGDGAALAYFGRYTGSVIEQVGSGLDAIVREATELKNGHIMITGDFTTAGSSTLTDRIAIWDGTDFYPLDVDLPGSPSGYGYPIDGDLYIGFSTSGTAQWSGKTTIYYEGTAHAYPTYIITRSGGTSASLQKIRSLQTGAEMNFDYDLADGETLTIVTEPDGVIADSSTYGRLWNIMKEGSAPVYLVSRNDGNDRQNQIMAFVNNNGATITATMLWRDTFAGLD